MSLELVATWGNLANRMPSFAYKRFEGHVPEPGELDDADRKLLAKVEGGFETVGELYNACRFRAALGECLAPPKVLTMCGPRGQWLYFDKLSTGLDRKSPWLQIKEDPKAAALSVWTVCKWRRMYKKEGRAGLTSRMEGPPTGALGQFPLEIRDTICGSSPWGLTSASDSRTRSPL